MPQGDDRRLRAGWHESLEESGNEPDDEYEQPTTTSDLTGVAPILSDHCTSAGTEARRRSPDMTRITASAEVSSECRSVFIDLSRIPSAIEKNAPTVPLPRPASVRPPQKGNARPHSPS